MKKTPEEREQCQLGGARKSSLTSHWTDLTDKTKLFNLKRSTKHLSKRICLTEKEAVESTEDQEGAGDPQMHPKTMTLQQAPTQRALTLACMNKRGTEKRKSTRQGVVTNKKSRVLGLCLPLMILTTRHAAMSQMTACSTKARLKRRRLSQQLRSATRL